MQSAVQGEGVRRESARDADKYGNKAVICCLSAMIGPERSVSGTPSFLSRCHFAVRSC